MTWCSIELRHPESVASLSCGVCLAILTVSLESPRFAHAVATFFEGHGECGDAGAPCGGGATR